MRSSAGVRNPRIGRTRENGMQSVSRITRIAIAVSLMLSAVFSVIAAIGFGGRANAGTSTTAGNSSTSDVRVALPPKGGGEAPPVQVAPPISQPVNQAPPVVSGGS